MFVGYGGGGTKHSRDEVAEEHVRILQRRNEQEADLLPEVSGLLARETGRKTVTQSIGQYRTMLILTNSQFLVA
jgi:hypothetical protein